MTNYLGREGGYSVLEIFVTLGLTALFLGSTVIELKALRSPAREGAAQVAGYLKRARVRALSSTSAITLSPSGTRAIRADSKTSCSASQSTEETELLYRLPTGSLFSDTSWSICFDSRGLSSSSATISVSDEDKTHQVQVAVGGAVRVL